MTKPKKKGTFFGYPAEYYSMCYLFGDKFKALREEKQLNQYDCAKALGVGKSTLWGWENYERIPRPHILVKIAKYFNVSIDYLFGVSTSGKSVDFDSTTRRFESCHPNQTKEEKCILITGQK